MDLLSQAFSRVRTVPAPETRAVSFQDVWGTGGNVDLFGNPAGMLSLVPLYATIRLIADQFASTPLHTYRERSNGSRERLNRDSPLIAPVHGSLATWKTQLIMGLLTRGNSFGIPTATDAAGWPTGVLWAPDGMVTCDETNPAAPKWYYDGRLLKPTEIIHVPWLVPPGKVLGLSPLAAFKVLWETGQAAQILARNFYDSGGVPSGHVKNTAQVLTPEQAEIAKDRFKKAVSGRDVLVTGNDWDYSAIGLPADQLAFVASLKLTATQIASIYGVAPEEVGGETGSSLTYATTEMNDLKLSGRTMRPWYERCESTFVQVTPRGQYLKFNADALVRADIKTRMEAHEIALRTGLETQPEGRSIEDRAPLTDAERADWLATYRTASQAPPSTREQQ